MRLKPTTQRFKRWARSVTLSGRVLVGASCLATPFAAQAGLFDLNFFDFNKDEKPYVPVSSEYLDQEHDVQDLAYGELLFEYFQEHYFFSLSKILVHKERDAYTHHDHHVDLMLGSLYIQYGMLDQAEGIFRQLIETGVEKATRQQAWYYLSHLYYKRGNYAAAKKILLEEFDDADRGLNSERLVLLSLIYIREEQYQTAIDTLTDVPSYTRLGTYATYNMGIAFSKLNEGEESISFLDTVMTLDHGDEEISALKDRAALALGVTFLKKEDWENAIKSLNEIRLYGPASDPGLLALGWARFYNSEALEALAPWLELANRDISSPAVQEVYLHIPFIYEQVGALQDALDGYITAADRYESERERLTETIQYIKTSDWVDTLSPSLDFRYDPLGALPPFEPPDEFSSLYLYRFFASHDFIESYRNYRELQRLDQVIRYWNEQIPVFRQMVDSNMNRYEQSLANAQEQARTHGRLLKESRYVMNGIDKEVQRILDEKDDLGTATTEERALWDRIQKLSSLVTALPKTEEYNSERERFERLRGLLLWDLQSNSVDRRWSLDKERSALNDELERLEQRLKALDFAAGQAQHRFDGFNSRIEDLEELLDGLQGQIHRRMSENRAFLTQIATKLLEENLVNLKALEGQTKLSIARLHDRAYVLERQREAAKANKKPRPKRGLFDPIRIFFKSSLEKLQGVTE